MERTYVVTGAASGIGRATATKLAALGHRIVTVDRHEADVVADLSSPDGRREMVEVVNRLTGGVVDAVVASAGTAYRGVRDLQVNYFGAVATLEGLRPMLATGTHPRAVAVTSFAVLDEVDAEIVDACLAADEPAALVAARDVAPSEQIRIYSSAKRALARWVRQKATAQEWAGAGIALNTVGPGVVHTPMTAPLLDEPSLAGALLDSVPMPFQGVLAPEAIAHHLVALTDPDMNGMTGQTIFVDGGSDCVRRGDDIW